MVPRKNISSSKLIFTNACYASNLRLFLSTDGLREEFHDSTNRSVYLMSKNRCHQSSLRLFLSTDGLREEFHDPTNRSVDLMSKNRCHQSSLRLFLSIGLGWEKNSMIQPIGVWIWCPKIGVIKAVYVCFWVTTWVLSRFENILSKMSQNLPKLRKKGRWKFEKT